MRSDRFPISNSYWLEVCPLRTVHRTVETFNLVVNRAGHLTSSAKMLAFRGVVMVLVVCRRRKFMNVNRQDIKKAKVYPQLIEYKARKKWRARRDSNSHPLLRRQMLYPAELRAHPWLLPDSTALARRFRVPTLRRFLEHLEQVHQIRRQRSPLPGGGS